MKGEWCIYADKMLFCQEQFCINCAVFHKWNSKTQKLLTEWGKKNEEIIKTKVQKI